MFITFEGTEGVGKSTLIKSIKKHLESQGHNIVLTREPGGTPLSEKLRALLLDAKQEEPICNDTELLMMYAARSQHINNIIIPALNDGKWVLCDRFHDSSFAYQGYGRGMDKAKIELLNSHFVTRTPDLTFWLDAPIEVGMSRATARGELDRFEQEKMAFFNKVRNGYAELHANDPKRIRRIDATRYMDDVLIETIGILKSGI